MKGVTLVCFTLILALAIAEAVPYYPPTGTVVPKPKEDKPTPMVDVPKPKQDKPPKEDKPKYQTKEVYCEDKYSPCYGKELYCPESCPQTCSVDCKSCQPVCPAVYSPPPLYEVAAKQVKCKSKNYPSCDHHRQFTCPADCPHSCEVDCATCKPVCNCNKPGAVCQDPKFIGADGLTFYFHGKKDRDFCLVSDSNLHINAHFIGKRNPKIGRDFTWVQALGLLFDNHKLYIGAEKTATWNDANDRLSISFDGQVIDLTQSDGAKWQSTSSGVYITRTRDTNAVEIEAEGKFKIKAVVVPITEKDSLIHKYGVTQEDCLAHLDLSFKFYSLSGEVSGVLGQTYARNYVSRVKMGVVMPVLGGEKEFSSSDLFTTDCAVARFNGKDDNSSSEGMEYADLNCATGLNGPGVVCKR